ncbi:MAG: hypothetical protein V4819_22325 [Verrucomicrobiota bacterium]
MPEAEAPTLIILLSICAGLLVLVLLLVLRISWRLSRIEKLTGQPSSRTESTDQAPSKAETSPGGAFEAFLAEDPSRRDLPKGEQFSAFRQWRHAKGMNWSNS